jgi:uncharacterized protein (DUF1330 family)
MTTNTGYAVEYQDGTRESVYNFATARYLVQNGNAERVYDTYFDRYVIIEVPENSL